MADVVDASTRSRMMSAIRGTNTKPELILRKGLFRRGFRYRLNDKRLSGKPDIVLPKWNAVILVHGCFWHRHAGCKYASTPATRPEFWQNKFKGNVMRDEANLSSLQDAGWRTAVVWECALRNSCGETVSKVANWLRSDEQEFLEIP
ncbi:very short patch repair endonuclease [Hyphomonas sp.]|uniref:very short patch repair endonuclease n=1 Tax=Hyphomonas sp. TaxID=87 RepID=UPI003D2999BA